MPRQKTKAQKKKSAQRRNTTVIQGESPEISGVSTISSIPQSASSIRTRSSSGFDAEQLLGFPVQLLYKDLLKSSIITFVLLAVLVGIYVYIQYNGVSLI